MSQPEPEPQPGGSTDVHQPGDSGGATLRPRDADGDPPDAVGADDDKGGGPEDRAPAAPEGASET